MVSVIFIADTSGNLVVSLVPCEVVLHCNNRIVYGIVPCKELITKGDVVVLIAFIGSLEDVDEREL